MFAYCGNNPITRKDFCGTAFETVFDLISLGTSVIEVVANPTDVFAWIGLVGDVIDVAVPFVGGIGETVDAVQGLVEGTDRVIDAAKHMKKYVSKSTGSYEIVFKSGKTYVGKGSLKRAIKSASDKCTNYSDEVASLTWKRAANQREAFINEYISMCKYGGPNNSAINNLNSYNKMWSPGRNYYFEDYGKYFE